MQIGQTKNFEKQFRKLPSDIRKKIIKQIEFITQDFFHPSLNTKRHGFGEDWWEFRIDKHYRMAGKKLDDQLILHIVGMHDVGLGKK